MPDVTFEELNAYAHQAAPQRHDAYSERALQHAYVEYLPRRRAGLTPFEITADGKPFESFFRILSDPASRLASGEIVLTDPPPAGPRWEYLVPFRSLSLAADGSAGLTPLDGATPVTRRVILRVLLREHYVPRSSTEEAATPTGGGGPPLRTRLATLREALEFVRTTGVVPFSVALLLYLPEERLRLELDLVGNQLLPDLRAGRFPLSRRVRRTSRMSHRVDYFVARNDLPILSTRALEVLVDSHGLTTVEVAHVLGGLRELAHSALRTLTARHLASYDRRTGIYRPRLDAFLSPTDRRVLAEEAIPIPAHPALRTSVAELLDAADSRATCPLCGDPLPAGYRSIICDRCSAEVNIT